MSDLDLVDEGGNRIGSAEKLAVHRPPARLHRAVSVLLFHAEDPDLVLLQRRADGVYHFGGRWSNTCCTHPRPGEPPEIAGRRRLREELGISAGVVELGSFIYLAEDPSSELVEFEFDHVLIGETDTDPEPNPDDVSDWEWIGVPKLKRALSKSPHAYSPWLPHVLEMATNQQ